MEKKEWDKYAKEYHYYFLSPLRKNVVNPLFDDLKKLKTKNKTVADIGTGRGELLPFLSKNFKQVHAIDFSKKMIETAKKRNNKKNITFHQFDTRNLSDLNLKLDVALTVNSILHPSFEDVVRSLKEIHKSLRVGGVFIGIFPAMESALYNLNLIYEREYKKYKDEKKALKKTNEIGERHKYNFIKSTYNEQGEKQRFYYQFDIENKLKATGFNNIVSKKVLYPWNQAGDYESFPEMPPMWDWYVISKKISKRI